MTRRLFPDFIRLSGLHSIWQFAAFVFPPLLTRWAVALPYYRLPLARLWVMQSIWQLSAELPPPLLHAETWSASISLSL
jgi:hypothetical protein